MKKSFLIITALLTVCSCNIKISPEYSSPGSEPICFAPVTGIRTKAPVEGTTFPAGQNIVLSSKYYHGSEAGSDIQYFSNLTFTRNGSTGKWEQSTAYWPAGGQLDFLAFSKLSSGTGIGTPTYGGTNVSDQVSVTMSDNSSRQEDLMFAYTSSMSKASTVPMNFRHAQALITFTAKSSIAYNSSTNVGITITGLTINDAKYSGTCTMNKNGTCTWTGLGSQTNKSVPGLASTNLTTTYTALGTSGIMVPKQGCTTATITYTLHNGKAAGGSNHDNTGLVKTIELTSPDSGNWEEGKKYNYQIDITQNGITFSPDVTPWGNAGNTEIQVPPTPPTFAGFQIAKGPLCYNGTSYEIADDWTVNSYNSAYGVNTGSTYFSFVNMIRLFESETVNYIAAGDIDNVLDPLDGWRLGTKEEWNNILDYEPTTPRTGSKVNSVSGVKKAGVYVSGVNYAGQTSIYGYILFPDDQVITGKSIQSGITNMTLAELNEYLSQGCVFLPNCGRYSSSWRDINYTTYYLTSSQSSTSGYNNTVRLQTAANIYTGASQSKNSAYNMAILIHE